MSNMRYYHHRRERRMAQGKWEEKEGERGRGRGRGRGRPMKEIAIEALPRIEELIPKPRVSGEEVVLTLAEYEAMRLVDFEGLNQDEAGRLMNVSRGTIWRLLKSGRIKLFSTIQEGKKLLMEKAMIIKNKSTEGENGESKMAGSE